MVMGTSATPDARSPSRRISLRTACSTHALSDPERSRNCRLYIWPNTGHMVHHSRTEEVVEAIEEVFAMAEDRLPRASAGSGDAEQADAPEEAVVSVS